MGIERAPTSEDSAMHTGRRSNMSFGMYMVGYIVLVVGLAVGAHLLHVPPRWIGVGIICMMGLGILTGVTTTRHRDPPT
jgi:hypothetical protein